MKKVFTLALGLIIAVAAGLSCVFAAEYAKFSKGFINNFKDCDAYEETTVSEYQGETFTTTRKIIGWRNGMCKYEETIKSKDSRYKLNCTLPSIQVDEIYEAMKDKSKEAKRYELETFIETKEKNGATKYVSVGTQTIKGNKAYIVWTKYQNNPYFCKPQKL